MPYPTLTKLTTLLRLLALAVALACVCLPKAAQADRGNVFFSGNEAVATAILYEVVDINAHATITEAMERKARKELLDYYQQRGYSLVRVWTEIFEGKLYVNIDEGKLEKIIVRGTGSVMAAMIRWLVELPHNTYNKELIDSQLEIIGQRFGIRNIEVQIWKSPAIKQVGFQLSDFSQTLFTREVATWELHLVVVSSHGSGPGVGAISSPYYGWTPYVTYRRQGVFFPNYSDSVLMKLETGFHVKRDLNEGGYELRFTHVNTGLRYDFPPLAGFVRFYSDSYLDTSGFQRPDLPLDEYWRFTIHSSLNLGFQLTRGFEINFGGGAEYTSLFGIETVTDDVFPVEPFSTPRYFVQGGFSYNMTPDEVRIDRLQLFSANYEFYQLNVSRWHRINVNYRQTIPIGYNDFITRMKVVYTIGATPFYDELALGGKLMRSFFKGRYYIDRAGYLSLEFRLSLWKDIIKISVYHDLAIFGQLSHDPTQANSEIYTIEAESETYGMANSFGPGFHWLIYDTFQFDVYGTFGFAPHGSNIAYYFEFTKVFF